MPKLTRIQIKFVTLAMFLNSQLAHCVKVHTMNFHPRSFAFLNSLVLKSFSPLSTRQRSAQLSPAVMLQPLSTSLQGGLRFVCHLCPTFPYALRLRFYPYYLHEVYGRERRASTACPVFSGFHVNDNIAGLGSSCLPAGQRPRIRCVKRG